MEIDFCETQSEYDSTKLSKKSSPTHNDVFSIIISDVSKPVTTSIWDVNLGGDNSVKKISMQYLVGAPSFTLKAV